MAGHRRGARSERAHGVRGGADQLRRDRRRDARPDAYVQNQTAGEHLSGHAGAVRITDERLDIPRARPNLFAFNRQNINLPGTTLFIPIADLTRQCISALLLYFDRPHGYYLVDQRLGADPLRPYAESGLLDDTHPVDLADFERWQMVDANGVESGLVIANLMTATQALGLGGHPFNGGKGRVTMGGERQWHAIGGEGPAGGLGFRFHRVPDQAPIGAGEEIPVGLDGLFEGAVPPYHDTIEDAVDFVVALRWGPEGTFTGGHTTPWTDPTLVQRIPRPSEVLRWTTRCTTSGAPPPATPNCAGAASAPVTRSSSGTRPPTATRRSSRTRTASTSPATRTRRSPSAAAARTAASASTWRASRSVSSWRSCSRGASPCTRPARPAGSAPSSPTASRPCPYAPSSASEDAKSAESSPPDGWRR